MHLLSPEKPAELAEQLARVVAEEISHGFHNGTHVELLAFEQRLHHLDGVGNLFVRQLEARRPLITSAESTPNRFRQSGSLATDSISYTAICRMPSTRIATAPARAVRLKAEPTFSPNPIPNRSPKLPQKQLTSGNPMAKTMFPPPATKLPSRMPRAEKMRMRRMKISRKPHNLVAD